MKNAFIICLIFLFSVCLDIRAYAEEIPEMRKCNFIVLRASEGWWLRINNDESGSYGFGTQPDKVKIKKDTFDFKQIYTETKKTSAKTRKNAEGPYIAASYYITGSNSAREYYLSQNRQWLATLFLVARHNALPPANEIEKRAYDKIEAIWKSSHFFSLTD